MRPSGSKSWIFARYANKKRYEFGLGSTRQVSLREARDKAAELRQALRKGRDPMAERRQAKVAGAPEANFGRFAEAFIKRIVSGFKNAKHRRSGVRPSRRMPRTFIRSRSPASKRGTSWQS